MKWFSNYEKAHQEALKQNRFLMVLLVEKIDRELMLATFMNQDYIQTINEKYISVIVQKDQKASYPIELLYTVEYPSLFFLDRYELYRCEALEGLIDPERLRARLKVCD